MMNSLRNEGPEAWCQYLRPFEEGEPLAGLSLLVIYQFAASRAKKLESLEPRKPLRLLPHRFGFYDSVLTVTSDRQSAPPDTPEVNHDDGLRQFCVSNRHQDPPHTIPALGFTVVPAAQ